MSKLVDLTGERFGRLLVVIRCMKNKRGGYYWECRCDCGGAAVVRNDNLRSGHTNSCGCIVFKHGLLKHPLYRVWANIKSRCLNKNDASFTRYGLRGIKICSEWLEFKPFYDFAISNGWNPNLQIDRRDNNGSYSPGNCRFVTRVVNQRNTSVSKVWVINGVEYQSTRSAGAAIGVSRTTIRTMCGAAGHRNDRPKAKTGCGFRLKYGVPLTPPEAK